MCNLMGRGFFIFLGKHLNDACKLSEFAITRFSSNNLHVFQMLLNLFFNSVKYFNKPKPCGVFF